MTKGLKFLSKKTWHPSTIQNTEKVWKAEQLQAEEERKIAEYKKQVQEEMEVQRLRILQSQSGGGKPYVERLDWMYEVPAAKAVSEYDYLSGNVAATLDEGKSDLIKVRESSAPGANFLENAIIEANDTFRRMNEDPMTAIKQKELESRKKVMNNPLLLKQARQKAIENLSQADKEKLLKLLSKSAENKKEELRSKNKGHQDSSSSSETESSRSSSRSHKRKSHHKRSISSSRSRSRSHHRKSRTQHKKSYHRRSSSRSRSRSNHRKSYHRRSSSSSRSRSRSYHKNSKPQQKISNNRKQNTYQVKKLTAEEKAEKLREMESDGKIHKELQYQRVLNSKRQDEEEAKANKNPEFLKNVMKQAYSVGKENTDSIADRISRNKAFYMKLSDEK